MDIESLKIILDVVKSVSGTAQTITIAWLVLDKLIPILAWVLFGFGVLRLLSKLITNLNSYNDMCNIRDSLNIGVPGVLEPQERKLVMQKIYELSKNKQP